MLLQKEVSNETMAVTVFYFYNINLQKNKIADAVN